MTPNLARSALAAAAAAALVALLFAGHAFLNYDTAYALLWGEQLLDGTLPELDIPLAPTPKPLVELTGMAGLGVGAWEVLAFAFLGIAGVLLFHVGSAWFGPVAGVAAAVLFLTREPVLSFGLRAYADVPYVCLVLGALLYETRRPRAGAPVLVLLAFAGLLRPEAWLFSAAYVLWLRDWRLLPLAAAAPLLWALHDLVITGDPLFSLFGTRESAEVLERRTGPVDLVLYGPRRLGEVLREPVLLGMVVGGVYAWRRRVRAPLAALGLALAAFSVSAIAGLPIITRVMLLPGALGCVLCGAALAAGLRDRAWAPASVVVLLALLVFAPGQADRLDRLERSLGIQERILADLEALPAGPLRCGPLAVTNRRPVPHLALRFGFVEPEAVRIGAAPGARTYAGPASRAVAEDFVFDPRDPVRVLPRLPGEFRRVAGNASWTVLSRC